MKRAATNQLSFSISPATVFISTNPDQSSYANISVSMKNTGTDALNVTSIAITLPLQLAPQRSLGSITPVAGQPNLWSFGPSAINAGEFDAEPQAGDYVKMNTGDTWQFTLRLVTLVSSITAPSAAVTAEVMLDDGSSIPASMNINIDAATQSIISFNSQPANISPGQSATLNWQCEEMNYCIISPIDNTHRDESGSLSVQPDSTTIYTLYAYADGVILSAQWAISVANPQIISFGGPGGKTHVNLGDNIVLSWLCNQFTEGIDLTNSAGIVIPPLLTGNNTVEKGSVTVGPIVIPTNFTFTAYGNDKKYFDQKNPTIYINDVTATLTADPGEDIWQGNKVVLYWDITNATAVSLSPAVENGPSLQNLSGSATIYPETDITYTLSVHGFTNNKPAHHDVDQPLVVQQVSISSFTQTPPQIVPGFLKSNEVTLGWNAAAQTASIDNGIGSVNPVGSKLVQAPANGTTYTLTAGTTLHPGLVTKTLQIINGFGPFTFNGIEDASGSVEGGYNLMVTNPLAMQYLQQGESGDYTPDLSGVKMTHGVDLMIQCYYSQPGSGRSYFHIFNTSIDFSVTIEWADPNNPTGTLTLW